MGAVILRGSPNPITVARAVFYALDKMHRTAQEVAVRRGQMFLA